MMELKKSFAELAKDAAEAARLAQERAAQASADAETALNEARTLEELAQREAEAPVAPTEDPLIGQLKERRNYWRQMTSDAREFIRAQDESLKEAEAALIGALDGVRETRSAISAMRKHWIGPKTPVKNRQEPHRSAV